MRSRRPFAERLVGCVAEQAPSDDVARWSSGQDGGLSRPKREFDSPTGHQIEHH